MVSADKTRRYRRARLEMVEFAVGPAGRQVVLATTPGRLVRSEDGGRTFAAATRAPPLVVLTWEGTSLYGAAPDGTVYRFAAR